MGIEIRMLGRFEVLADGERRPADPWRRRHAAALVKVLALADGRSLHREQLIDLLWPDSTVAESAPRLHKAAHYARRGIGDPLGVVLRGETVTLLPGRDVVVDARRFEAAALAALDRGGEGPAAEALGLYAGPLLPADLYEPWAETNRERLSLLHRQMLRQAGRWADLVALDPSDEEAHVAVMRALLAGGDRTGALRQFERLDRALRHELGIAPSEVAVALRDEALAAVPTVSLPQQRRAAGLVARDAEMSRIRRVMAGVSEGAGRSVLVSGPAGVGKSSLLAWTRAEAARRGWRVGHGVAAAVEGAWPYAPVMEALGDLCRRHPSLLDGLADSHRAEIERAVALRDLDWTPDGGHQRLFVATADLLRLAAATGGVVLVVDDLHEADDASLRLLHYLSRLARSDAVLLVLAHRDGPWAGPLDEVRASLFARDAAVDLPLEPLDERGTSELVARRLPGASPEVVARIWALSAGLPFAVEELARAAKDPGGPVPLGATLTARMPAPIRELLTRVAVAGTTFDTDEFVVLSGLPEPLAFARLESAVAARLVEPTGAGYRFRHPLLREALLAGLPPHRRRQLHRDAARGLGELDASPARVGHHLVQAGDRREAAPFLLRAAETEAAVGAYRDALRLVEEVRGHVVGAAGARLAALRGDLLAALGDPAAVDAYREAVRRTSGELRRRARAGLARTAVLRGDLATAGEALDGLDLNGGPNDTAVLLARGTLAYFRGDLDAAWATTEEARRRVSVGEESWQLFDLVGLQGLVAHSRGEWFERLRIEMQHGRDAPQVAAMVFDSHLCVAEYLLYGPTPYREVMSLARSMRSTAERAGVLRAVGFAGALLGEAALLSGDLELAESELRDAADLHQEMGARAGEAHCLQRLAEVRLAQGDRAGAQALLDRALPLARWSSIALHLLHRVYGTMIAAADGPAEARAVVDRAEATLGEMDFCPFCAVMFAVPACIACADAGDVPEAERHLAVAERWASLWEGTAWQAAISEARGHLALATGDRAGATRLLDDAAHLFATSGQPLDAARVAGSLAGRGRAGARADP